MALWAELRHLRGNQMDCKMIAYSRSYRLVHENWGSWTEFVLESDGQKPESLDCCVVEEVVATSHRLPKLEHGFLW